MLLVIENGGYMNWVKGSLSTVWVRGEEKVLRMLQYPLRHWLTQKFSLMRFGHERLEGNWARHVEDDVPGLLTSSCISLKRLPHPDTTCAWMKLSRNEYVLLTFKPNQVSRRQLPMSIIQQQGGPVYNAAINRELQSIIQQQGGPVLLEASSLTWKLELSEEYVSFCLLLSSPSRGCHSPGLWPRLTFSMYSKDCDVVLGGLPAVPETCWASPCLRSCAPVFPFEPFFWICLFSISLQSLVRLHPFRPSPDSLSFILHRICPNIAVVPLLWGFTTCGFSFP